MSDKKLGSEFMSAAAKVPHGPDTKSRRMQPIIRYVSGQAGTLRRANLSVKPPRKSD